MGVFTVEGHTSGGEIGRRATAIITATRRHQSFTLTRLHGPTGYLRCPHSPLRPPPHPSTICYFFCPSLRSFLDQSNKMDFTSNNLGFCRARAITASVGTGHSSGHQPPDCRACGERSAVVSVGAAETIAASQVVSEVPLPSI